jgi:ABC-type uncharacterized transport system auxiliary subunit
MRALAVAILLAACALTSKAPPVQIRYFSPVPSHAERRAAQPVHGRLRIGSVTASSYLGYRIAHRRSPVELELSDTLRWTEQPDDYVRRAVAQALFVHRGIEQVVSGNALTLDVEVTAFEHVERAGRHFGRVQLRYSLEDDQRVIAHDVVTVEREAQRADIASVVTAIGDALAAASDELADRVAARIASGP